MHREGRATIVFSLIFIGIVLGVTNRFCSEFLILLGIVFAVLFGLILWFFRNPKRSVEKEDDALIYAPADGKVVVIEQVNDAEYFQADRMQISIFMSPLNVHVNRNPISGQVKYAKYHPGKYLAAWNPKSSTENERTTVVIQNAKASILFRQIAGALARRIVYYVSTGDQVRQGEEMGFIKFGSRVDVLVPLDSEILVNLNETVSGAGTVLARLK